ncbi:MAG: hypothetical protein ABSD13_20460, partial [Candidatus Korobacteraceae bacterium]
TPCVAADPSSAAFLLHLCLTHTALTANRKNEIPSRVFQQSQQFLERLTTVAVLVRVRDVPPHTGAYAHNAVHFVGA